MRTLFVPAGLAAIALATAVHAQPQSNPLPPAEIETPEGAGVNPGPASTNGSVRQVPSWQAQPGAVPAADGVIYQWGPSSPVVEAVPPPASSYPPCTNGRTDSCTNPDPSRELPYYPADKG